MRRDFGWPFKYIEPSRHSDATGEICVPLATFCTRFLDFRLTSSSCALLPTSPRRSWQPLRPNLNHHPVCTAPLASMPTESYPTGRNGEAELVWKRRPCQVAVPRIGGFLPRLRQCFVRKRHELLANVHLSCHKISFSESLVPGLVAHLGFAGGLRPPWYRRRTFYHMLCP